MLTESKKTALSFPRKQNGVVLIIAMIVLVAMTLAGIALMRSVDTSNLIAGNLAYRQAATHASDKGIEAAIAWLTSASATNDILIGNTPAPGYSASRAEPSSTQNWNTFWTASLSSNAVIVAPDPDAAGNTVSYFIHRLCTATGDPLVPASGCSFAPVACDQTTSVTIPPTCFYQPAQVYYRITSKITGPRGTISYIQAIVAL